MPRKPNVQRAIQRSICDDRHSDLQSVGVAAELRGRCPAAILSALRDRGLRQCLDRRHAGCPAQPCLGEAAGHSAGREYRPGGQLECVPGGGQGVAHRLCLRRRYDCTLAAGALRRPRRPRSRNRPRHGPERYLSGRRAPQVAGDAEPEPRHGHSARTRGVARVSGMPHLAGHEQHRLSHRRIAGRREACRAAGRMRPILRAGCRFSPPTRSASSTSGAPPSAYIRRPNRRDSVRQPGWPSCAG